MTLRPAAEGSGIRFRRVDRPGSPIIPARVDNLVVADGMASLEHHSGARVHMIEHLLAALSVCEIDNLLIDVSAAELPAMDGSARPFVLLIECAGTVEQDQAVARFELLRPVAVSSSSGYARLEPARRLELVVDSPAGMLGRPFAITVSPEACKSELMDPRAASIAGTLRSDGLEDAAARHEALVALGALALIPAKIDARYVARGAHAALRCQLLRRLVADRDNWRLTGGAREAAGWLHAATGAAAHQAYAS